MMDRIGDLTLFLRILDLGSISAAARSLDLSAAVGSQRIKRLENDLGVSLLHRTTRRLHATPEGLLLAERSRTMVEDLESVLDGLRRRASSVSGVLRVSIPASFGRQYISPLLPAFMSRYPQVKLSVDLTDRMVDLVGSGYDLAIRIGALADSSLIARKLADNRRVLCASPAYLEQHGTPQHPDDLAAHECLLLTAGDGRHDIWRLTDPGGNEVVARVGGRIHSNQGELLRDAAVAGLGIAQHSVWHIADDLRAGRLRVVLPDCRIADTGIHAVMPQRHLVPARVCAFVEFIEEHIGWNSPWETGGMANGAAENR